MTTYRKTYALQCGSLIKDFGYKKPTFKDLAAFTERNTPTNNDIVLVRGLKEVPDAYVAKGRKSQ